MKPFVECLEASKDPLTQKPKDHLWNSIDRLLSSKSYSFKLIQLGSYVDEQQAADIFVLTNSKCIRLDNSDFILTLMSV